MFSFQTKEEGYKDTVKNVPFKGKKKIDRNDHWEISDVRITRK